MKQETETFDRFLEDVNRAFQAEVSVKSLKRAEVTIRSALKISRTIFTNAFREFLTKEKILTLLDRMENDLERVLPDVESFSVIPSLNILQIRKVGEKPMTTHRLVDIPAALRLASFPRPEMLHPLAQAYLAEPGTYERLVLWVYLCFEGERAS